MAYKTSMIYLYFMLAVLTTYSNGDELTRCLRYTPDNDEYPRDVDAHPIKVASTTKNEY